MLDLLGQNCAKLPIAKQIPTYSQTELATNCQISKPIETTSDVIPSKARKIQSNAIVIKAGFSRGTLRMRPAPENANIVQANISVAIIIVPIGASIVPC